MRYFVVAEDGSKYGPADVKLLNAWVGEGRLLPLMTLEEEGTQHQVTAASVEGLDFYVLESPTEPTTAPVGDVLAMTYEPPIPHDSEKLDMFIGWAMILITLVLTPFRGPAGILGIFTAVLGLVAGMKAKDRGYESAAILLALNLFALVVWCLARLFFILR